MATGLFLQPFLVFLKLVILKSSIQKELAILESAQALMMLHGITTCSCWATHVPAQPFVDCVQMLQGLHAVFDEITMPPDHVRDVTHLIMRSEVKIHYY